MSERATSAEPVLDDEDGRGAEAEDHDDDELDSEPEPRGREDAGSFWQFLRRTYGTADPRSLGLLRIALGLLLIGDLVRRFPDLSAHYSNAGWLSNHFMLFRPMSSHLLSVYLAFSTPGEVELLAGFHLLVYVLFTIGWRTRVMHVLSAILLVSINSRNIAIENGGWVVLTLLTVWTMFLPLGRRFSIDALLASLKARREGTESALNDRSEAPERTAPVVSLAVAALILQWITIYYFNVVHKTGSEWRDGTAVYYFFEQDRMVTTFGAAVREYLPLWAFKGMTYGALLIESAVTVLLISPFAIKYVRMIAWALVCMLHLGIDSVVQLGPFSYAMITVFFAFIPREFWDAAGERLRAKRPRAKVEFDPKNAFALFVCGLLKRFDGLERLTFRAKDGAKGLAVVLTGHRRSGLRGLREFTKTLPLPFLGRALLYLPGVGRTLKRGLAAPARLTRLLELDNLPGSDERKPESPRARVLLARGVDYAREAIVLVVMVACVSQVLIENRAVPPWLKVENRPDWMTAIVIYPRLFQGWSMFAPSPPVDDGRVVVDGLTKDGRRFDPLTGEAPNFEVQLKGGFGMNQIWGDFHRRIHEQRFEAYWDGFREFLRNHHQLSGRPEDELASFDVYMVSERIPPPGQPHAPPNRRKLFSFTNTAQPSKGRPSKPAASGVTAHPPP